MTLLCLVTSLFQLVLLVTLTGILVSVAAVSRLMEVAINLIHPTTVFLLHQSGKLIVPEVILMDLNTKFPSLQYILRPEYAPYLNTAGTVLLGWLIVSWMSYIMWTLLAPLSLTAIAVILVCPKTIEWIYKQASPGFENSLRSFMDKFRITVSQTYSK